ncbi:MAG: hypothetical protein H5T69_15410 [Chloroflexi bacterium]|nr:hypothetical protein [Chloroflexota bacterium]
MPATLSARNLAAVSRLPKGELASRLFFFEETPPAGAFNVHPVYAPVRKVPVYFEGLEGGRGTLATFASSIVALEGGGYRLYGTCLIREAGQPARGDMRIWESGDGLEWTMLRLREEEPVNLVEIHGVPGDTGFMVQPQIVPLRDGRWRLYFWKHRDEHLRYTIAESDDGLAWEVTDFERPALYHPRDGGLWRWAEGLAQEPIQESASLSPAEILRRKRLASNDATYMYYNEALDRYECYSVWLHPAVPERRVDVDNAPGVHRLIQRRVSEDGLNWSDAELVLMPDERDPWDLQFYFMAVQWHHDWMIGSVGHYRVEAGQQTQDLALCFSREGRLWRRPVRGGFIPRTGEETPQGWGAGERDPTQEDTAPQDSAGIYAPNVWLEHENGWLILYSATPDPHNRNRGRTRPLGAVIGRNRFVGLAAGRTRGGWMTEPFIQRAPCITVDARVRGWLRAELCDAFGHKLPGHHLGDSVPVQGDLLDHVLRWRGQPSDLYRYKALRVRFELIDGEVYGLEY